MYVYFIVDWDSSNAYIRKNKGGVFVCPSRKKILPTNLGSRGPCVD